MATLTADEILKKVKAGLGITGDYQDEALNLYIGEVLDFMSRAGVPDETARGSEAVGIVVRGVADLWNYGSGSVKLSDYFIQRVNQLAAKGGEAGA